MQALQIFHINVNCSNLERSLAFYGRIGFQQVIDFNQPNGTQVLGEPQLGPALGLPSGSVARARMLTLGDDPRSARLDLIEWQDTNQGSTPYSTLTHLGIGRICLRVKNIVEAYKEMVAAGATQLIVINGSPYEHDKSDERLALAQERVAETGLPLIYANQVGGQDVGPLAIAQDHGMGRGHGAERSHGYPGVQIRR